MRHPRTLLLAAIALVLSVTASAQLNSQQIKNSLAFYHTHLKRLVFAIGPDTVQYVEDFVSFPDAGAAAEPLGWTSTLVETGSADTEIDVVTTTGLTGGGGILQITADNLENDGGSYQLRGTSFKVTSGQVLYVGVFGLKLNDVTQTDFFIGLAATDTAIMGGVTDSIGFRKADASAVATFVVEKDSTETTANLATMVDATAVDLEFYWDGAGLEVFVNGASVASPAVTNVPDDESLRVSIEFLTGEAVANTLDIDTLRVIQIGR